MGEYVTMQMYKIYKLVWFKCSLYHATQADQRVLPWYN